MPSLLKPPVSILLLLLATPLAVRAQSPAPDGATTRDVARPAVVCLKLALQCFERKAPATAVARRSLDLAAPDVRTLIPTHELQAMMADTEEQESYEAANSVRVEGRPNAPLVPGGLAGLWWAAKHPTQAWRLFTPVQ